MKFPEGHYKKVYVHNMLGGGVLLWDGTGTSRADGVFSCGPFAEINRLEINEVPQYKITAKKDNDSIYESRFKCVHSGHTSDFSNFDK